MFFKSHNHNLDPTLLPMSCHGVMTCHVSTQNFMISCILPTGECDAAYSLCL